MIWKENKRMLGHTYFVEGVQDYAAINFIQNHRPPPPPPEDKPLGHDSKGAKTLSPGQSFVYKNPPPGQNLIEIKNYVISTNKTVFQ